MISLAGKNSLITGGSRGIGKATAIIFAESGCNIAIGYEKNETAANATVEQCQSHGVQAMAIRANMGNRSEVFEMVDQTAKTLGSIDILVNNAGIWENNPIDEMTEERLRKTVDINLMGCFHSCQAVVPHMKERKSGNIINISSTAAQRGEAFHSPYSATKAALIGLTKSLAVELADYNIRVNCVCPGATITGLMREQWSVDPSKKEAIDQLVEMTPMGRYMTVDEMAETALFLVSDKSSGITGLSIPVDGGRSAG